MKSYKILVRVILSEYVDLVRKRKRMTQEEMAERLRITSRAYGDLERGKYCFSTVVFLFFLLMLEDGEIQDLLDDFRSRVYNLEQQDPADEGKSISKEMVRV